MSVSDYSKVLEARKDHICTECECLIPKGDDYFCWLPGKWKRTAYCLPCAYERASTSFPKHFNEILGAHAAMKADLYKEGDE